MELNRKFIAYKHETISTITLGWVLRTMKSLVILEQVSKPGMFVTHVLAGVF